MIADDTALRVFVTTIVALDGLRHRDHLAFAEAILVARDPGHAPAPAAVPVLKGWGLLNHDGFMPGDTRAAVLSSRYAQETA